MIIVPYFYRKMSLPNKIFLGMIAGALLGIVIGEPITVIKPLGDVFLRLLLMAAIPLVFFNLVAGLASLKDVGVLGRVGGRILFYYTFTSAMAVFIGVTLSRIFVPGEGFQIAGVTEVQEIGELPKITEVLLEMIPNNAFAAFSNGELTQVIVFAIFIGIVILLMPEKEKSRLEGIFDVLRKMFLRLVGLVMGYAPIGVASLMAVTVGQYGSKIVGPLGKFVAIYYLGWLIQAGFVYLPLLFVFTRISPIEFIQKTYSLYITTASTCSSLATVPVTLQVAEENLNLPKEIIGFTVPLGAQINKDGTCILYACALVFAAQVVGFPLSIGAQVSMIIIGTLLSMGGGGIPGGGIVVTMILLKAFNLPLEVGALLAGIYRLIDMGTTTLNCMGDVVGSAIVSHLELRRNDKLDVGRTI